MQWTFLLLLICGYSHVHATCPNAWDATSQTYECSWNNSIVSIPSDIVNYPTMIELWLNDNAITSIPNDAFAGLTDLLDLDLSNNLITSIQANVFSVLTSLISLYLHINSITLIDGDAFAGLTSLITLKIGYNTLQCYDLDNLNPGSTPNVTCYGCSTGNTYFVNSTDGYICSETASPTISPTLLPTVSPTTSPTPYPTKVPTTSLPTASPMITTTTATPTGSDEEDEDDSGVVIGLSVAGGVVFVALVGGLVWYTQFYMASSAAAFSRVPLM